jgi:hypothetical protein
MRNPRNEKGSHDPTMVYDLKELIISDDDCFGRLFDLSLSSCSMCHDNDVCAVVYDHHSNKKKIKEVKKPFIDVYNFDAVRKSDLNNTLKNNPGVYSREMLFDAVSSIANCDNVNLVNDFINSLLEELKMKIEDGFIVYRK